MSKLSALYLGLVFFVVGCASTSEQDKTLGWSPNRIYQEARDEQAAGNNDKAAQLYEKLEGRAAGTPLAQQAMLDAAYMRYKTREPAYANSILERFMRTHPTSPAMDYALYLKGLVNFNDESGFFGFLNAQDLSERDQKAAKDAFETFRELVTRFPDSKYAKDAQQRMAYIVNALAQYEVNVARYYLKRGAYLAAVSRAQQALTDYPQSPALEEALAVLVQAYDAMGLTQLRDDNKRVLQSNFPQSRYLKDGIQEPVKSWWKLW